MTSLAYLVVRVCPMSSELTLLLSLCLALQLFGLEVMM